MSWNVQPRNAKIKRVESKGKVVRFTLTTFRRQEVDGEEKYYPTVTYGVAFGAAKDFIESLNVPDDGMMVHIDEASIRKEPYKNNDGSDAWPNNHTVYVFKISLAKEFQGGGSQDAENSSAADDDDEFPF